MAERRKRAPKPKSAASPPGEKLPAATAIIVAAGSSTRMGRVDKLFAPLAGQPLLYHTLAAFEACDAINHIMLVLSENSAEPALALLRDTTFMKVDGTCRGGARRQDSVRAGIQAVRACDWVVVHDAARPLVTPKLIEAGIVAAQATGAASAGLPVTDTLKEVASDGTVLWTIDRERMWAVQTPQVFRFSLLLAAHERDDADATDDAALVERLGVRVCLFLGSRHNLKVTTPEDLVLAGALLQLRQQSREGSRLNDAPRPDARAQKVGGRPSPRKS